MKYTVEKMKHILRYFDKDRKLISLNGYAFISKHGRCMIIAYGENRRDQLIKFIEDGTI